MSRRDLFRKDHLFRTFEVNIIFPCIFFFFLRKIIFHFPFVGKIIFSGKRNIIFPNNTRKIKFQRNFFGKTVFSGRLEKESMVFRAVIAAFAADAAAVNSNGIKTLLANGLSTFPIKSNPGFSNGPKSLRKDPSGCPILCN